MAAVAEESGRVSATGPSHALTGPTGLGAACPCVVAPGLGVSRGFGGGLCLTPFDGRKNVARATAPVLKDIVGSATNRCAGTKHRTEQGPGAAAQDGEIEKVERGGPHQISYDAAKVSILACVNIAMHDIE